MLQKLLRKQKISERLRTSLCIIDTVPSTRFIRIWQAVHGNTPFAIIQLIFSILLLETLPNSTIPKGDRFMNLFVVAVFLVTTESILFWTYRRARAETVVKDMIAISEKIEKMSTEEQISDMKMIAGISNILSNAYYTSMFGAMVVYATYPFIQGCNLGALPALGNDEAAFWGLYVSITTMFAVGPLSTISFVVYHLQTCLCLSGLFQNLGKQVLLSSTAGYLHDLLPVHQELLRIAYTVRDLFYRSCFFQIGGYVCILIANTSILTEERNPGVCFVIAMNISFIYFMCSFSESVTMSCAEIGDVAYCSDWIAADDVYKKKLLFIITKSGTLVYFKAGWIGRLQVHKFTSAMKLWYQLVNVLLKLA